MPWKDWCWNSNTFATWCKELTHWKRPWCWKTLSAGREGDDKGQDGWMAPPTLWTWVWASSRRWGRNGEPGVLQSVGSQRLGHNWETEQPFMPSPPKWGKKNCFHLQANYLQFYSSHPPGPPESLKVHADSRKCSIFYKLNFSNLFTKMVWSIPPNMSGAVVAVQWLICVSFFRTVAHQAPLSMGFPRQEYWSGLTFPPPRDHPDPGIEPVSLALAGRFFSTDWLLLLLLLVSRFSRVRLCDPIDSQPPASTIPGILQARILEWVAISFSNAWKWKVKVNLLSRVQLLATPWIVAY